MNVLKSYKLAMDSGVDALPRKSLSEVRGMFTQAID